MILRIVAAAALFSAGFAGGLFLSNTPPLAPAQPVAQCTPSVPHTAAQADGRSVVLLWGNSLLRDHGWRLGDRLVANCAVQGMTAAAALPRMASLPPLSPDHVVITFGSVELHRAAKSGTPVDLNSFNATIGSIVSQARKIWPGAAIIVTGAPSFADDQSPAINDTLRQIAREATSVTFLDLNAALAPDMVTPEATYDGVHLTAKAYEKWQAQLNAAMTNR